MTYRHAVKDADNNVPFGETLPMHYNALAGLTVEETESLQDYDAFPVVGSGVFEGVEGTGGIFCDIGLVELELIPGPRNKKRILLTDAGRELEKNTTDRLRGAEIRAYGKLSAEELNSYLEMTRKLTAALREETEKL